MTGADLNQLRHDYALGSTRNLARRIGCHPSTINRNVLRAHVTPYVMACIDATNTARAFWDGVKTGRCEAAVGRY